VRVRVRVRVRGWVSMIFGCVQAPPSEIRKIENRHTAFECNHDISNAFAFECDP